MKMFANKYGKDKFKFVYDSELKVRMCFPMHKPFKGTIVEVEVTEKVNKEVKTWQTKY